MSIDAPITGAELKKFVLSGSQRVLPYGSVFIYDSFLVDGEQVTSPPDWSAIPDQAIVKVLSGHINVLGTSKYDLRAAIYAWRTNRPLDTALINKPPSKRSFAALRRLVGLEDLNVSIDRPRQKG